MVLKLSATKKLVKLAKPVKEYIEQTCDCGKLIRIQYDADHKPESYTCQECGELWVVVDK
tara:strand:+ start:697 stop:876 length:180 start_codon:yes stop_codon:yes gene_type:complete